MAKRQIDPEVLNVIRSLSIQMPSSTSFESREIAHRILEQTRRLRVDIKASDATVMPSPEQKLLDAIFQPIVPVSTLYGGSLPIGGKKEGAK